MTKEHNAPASAEDLAGRGLERERVDDLPAGSWPLVSPEPTPPAKPDPPVETPTEITTPVGALRTVGQSHFTYAAGDEVLPCGATYGWGLGKLRADRDACLRDLDDLAAAGYEFVRTWFSLGFYPYWRGREVAPVGFVGKDGADVPVWTDYYNRVEQYSKALTERGLGLFWSCGDLQMFNGDEAAVAWARQCGEVIRSAGGVIVCADVNEAWQNFIRDTEPYPDEIDAIVIDPLAEGYGGEFLRLRSAAAGSSEEVDDLNRWSRGLVWQKHGHRGHFAEDHVSAIRHAWGIGYDEIGLPASRLGVESEPGGPAMDLGPHANVYGPLSKPEALCLLAVANWIAPAAYVWHSHRGVQSWLGPVAAEAGCAEVPAARDYLPADLQSSFRQLVHGGRVDSPLTDADGFPEGDDRRIDSALAADGRFVSLVYSKAPGTLIRARRDVEGDVIVPHTGERQAFALRAGETLDLAYDCGRVIVGEA